jgi:hypothetical protein
MNQYYETEDGEATIIVEEGTAQITIQKNAVRGTGKLKDIRKAWAALRGEY